MTARTEYDQTLEMAFAEIRAGRLDAADHLLRHASGLDPAAAVPHFLLGANAAQAGLVDEAESAFIASLSRAPGFAIARFQLGLLQMTNARPAAAAATWEPLFLLDDAQPLKHFAAGMLDIARGDAASARRRIEAGLALDGGNPALTRDMQGVLSRLDDAPAAPTEPEAAPAEHVLLSGYRRS